MGNYYLRNTIIIASNSNSEKLQEEDNNIYSGENGGAEGENTGSNLDTGANRNTPNGGGGVTFNPNIFKNIDTRFGMDTPQFQKLVDAQQNGLMPQGNLALIQVRNRAINSGGWTSWDNGVTWFYLHNGKYYTYQEVLNLANQELETTRDIFSDKNWANNAIENHPCKQSGNCQLLQGWADLMEKRRMRKVINGKVVFPPI